MKSICKFVLFFLLAVSALGVTAIANEIAVTIDGRAVHFADQPPTVVDNRTLVPVRGVFEHLGFYVTWDGDVQQATLTREDFTVIISVGSATFTTNGASHTLDVPAQIINNRTMLPIRAVLESVGVGVEWDGGTSTVLISTAPVAEIATPEIAVPIPEIATPETAAPAEPTAPAGNAQPGETMQFAGRNWRVLDVQGSYAKLLHETIITYQPYHHTSEDVTWEASSSRQWLNNDFYNTFSDTDRARIRETYVVNSDNPSWGTPGGNNTTDKIFSLSIDEAVQLFDDGHIRREYIDDGPDFMWWLRSPGRTPIIAALVDSVGDLDINGFTVDTSSDWFGLRPALWLNLES